MKHKRLIAAGVGVGVTLAGSGFLDAGYSHKWFEHDSALYTAGMHAHIARTAITDMISGNDAWPELPRLPASKGDDNSTASPSPGPDTEPTAPTQKPIPKVLTYAHLSDPGIAQVVDMGTVLAAASPLPAPDAPCRKAIARARSSLGGLAAGSSINCWPAEQLAGGWNPQGVGGFSTAGFMINGQPASSRNVVSYSWYTTQNLQSSLVKTGGHDRSRLTLVEDGGRSVNIELVQRDGNALRPLPTHGGANAFAGDWLYVGSKDAIFAFPADTIYMIGGKFMMVSDRKVSVGCKSSAFSITDGVMSAAVYKTGGKTNVCSRRLGDDGLPTGPVSHASLKARNTQGVARIGNTWLLNSSADDKMRRFNGTKLQESYQFPHTNIQGISVDLGRRLVHTCTEEEDHSVRGRQINLLITVGLDGVLR